MKVFARIIADLKGSGLYIQKERKLLGEPILMRVLREIQKADFIDEIFVLTDNQERTQIARSCKCHVVPVNQNYADFHGGFHDLRSMSQAANDYITDRYGKDVLEIPVYWNSHYCLMSKDILEAMFVRLMEDRTADSIVPVAKIDPHLYLENPKTGSFFPFWEHSSLDRQDYPGLYRSGGIRIMHPGRAVASYGQRVIFHEVTKEDLLFVDSHEKVQRAEYYLLRRMGGTVVLPEQHDHQQSLELLS